MNKTIEKLKKWIDKTQQELKYNICYCDMEDKGIAVFRMCDGTGKDKNICNKCKYYCEVSDDD